MPLYNVHVYGICRVKVWNVEAPDPQAATEAAYEAAVDTFNTLPDRSTCESPDGEWLAAQFAGFADDISGYLVDEIGDDEHRNSRDYDREGNQLEPIASDAERPELLDLLRRLNDWALFMGGWEAPIWREVTRVLQRHGSGAPTAGGAFEDCAAAADAAAADVERPAYVGCYSCPECGNDWNELFPNIDDATCPRCAEPHVQAYDSFPEPAATAAN